MKRKDKSLFIISLVVLFLFAGVRSNSQGAGGCSENIGFELGTFKGWETSVGTINRAGVINVVPAPPASGRHTIIQNTYPQALDQYGDFPVNCPNGSGYSVRLGNSQTQGEADQISYTFTVPANQSNYSIIYNYAVVLENPSHQQFEQPKFTSRVFDVTSGEYVQCGSFEFVASGNLPGFRMSAIKRDVFYKAWSPITVNLYGYAGKTIRLEFSSNDCTLGGHFGYAYLDVNENCASPISGNVYCNGANALTLTAPFGFKEYRWFNADFSQVLGTENILKFSTPPPPGTVYSLEIVPFPGLGCLDTLSTTIQLSSDAFNLNVIDSVIGCVATGANLTSPSITAGSTPGLTYSYFMDANQTTYMPTPKVVKESGVYFIKAVNSAGCNDVKPIKVIITEPPNIEVKNPPAVCQPGKVDLTLAIGSQNDPRIVYTYWKDASATIQLRNPTSVDSSGIYYINGGLPGGCSKTVPVTVSINSNPVVSVTSAVGCGKVDLTAPIVIVGSESGLTYTYWQDTAATIDLPTAKAVTTSGKYFLKATNAQGCSTIKPVQTTVNSYPSFTTSAITVTYPTSADLTSSVTATGPGNLKYSYWTNQQITLPVTNPKKVDARGTYYVRATSEVGCIADLPIIVTILAPPAPRIVAPTAFSPNNDGINDVFKTSIIGEVQVGNMKVYNRYGQLVFTTIDINKFWDGAYNGRLLPVGTYYWVFEGRDLYKEVSMKASGSITLLQ